MTITLYDMQDSPHARKVRLLAAELGIPLQKIERDPRKGETRSPDYLAMNPNGRVPTLKEDGFCLWELPAILKYLAAKRPERALGGSDAQSQGLIDQWLFWWAAGPEAAVDALVWEMLIKPKVLNQPGNDPGIVADAHTRACPLPAGARPAARGPRLHRRPALASPISPSARASTGRQPCSSSTSRLTRISPRG